jgi:hypothetical protein
MAIGSSKSCLPTIRAYAGFKAATQAIGRRLPNAQCTASSQIGIALPGAIPIELEIGARLGSVFGNLTQILGGSDVDDLSAAHTKALLPHYPPFGLPDVDRRAGPKIFGRYD